VEGHTFVDGDEYEQRLLSVRTGLDYRSLGVKVDRGDLPSLLPRRRRRRLPVYPLIPSLHQNSHSASTDPHPQLQVHLHLLLTYSIINSSESLRHPLPNP
jgi:hypothetical protein